MIHKFIHITCENCGHGIDVPVYCGNRFCSVCSPARRKRVHDRLQFLVKNTPYRSGYSFKFLTLTISNMPDLEIMCAFLLKCFRKLRSRALWKKLVSGGAFVIEVTGRPGNWHAHLHVMMHCKYIPRDHLVKAWQKISGGIGVDIRRIPLNAIINHLCKYLSKRQEPDIVTEEKDNVLKAFRLFQPFGTWYKLQTNFKRKPHPCPKCGKNCWTPWDISQGFFIDEFWKETEPNKIVDSTRMFSFG